MLLLYVYYSECTNTNSNDATVFYCEFSIVDKNVNFTDTKDSTRIWNSNPYPGMICLQEGRYSNQGHVEVYCNEQWGTICHDEFSSTDANTICKQLGYTGYTNYNHLTLLVVIIKLGIVLRLLIL